MGKKLTIEYCVDLAKLKNGLCLDTTYSGVSSHLNWQCSEGHIWKAKLSKIKEGRWCPDCYVDSRKITLDKCIKIANINNGFFLSVAAPKNSKIKVLWKCSLGHKFFMNYNNIQSGQWCSICAEDKRMATRIRKYGYPYLMQNNELSLRASKTKNQITILYHWKTNKEVYCRGSWEVKVVEYLNLNKKDFIWQPKAFPMVGGRTYTPDLYLSDLDLWVEIKGYFWGDAQEKWDWFHQTHPNSELWNEKKLKIMNIL